MTAALLALVATAAGMAVTGGAGSPARHLLLVPVVWLAITRGRAAGAAAGLAAGLLQAPLVLPLIEAEGFGARAIDGGVAMATPLAAGLLLGRMADELRGRAARLSAVLAIQRTLAAAGRAATQAELGAVAEAVRRALGVSSAGIVLDAGSDARAVASAPPGATLHPRSAAVWVASTGCALVLPDVVEAVPGPGGPPAGAGAPRRGLLLPLRADGQTLGALAIETRGDLLPGARAAAEELAMYLALALENARLGLLQRRFAEELEAKVAAATRSLRELDRAKSELVSVVSHELRTPLTALQGFAELLLGRDVPADRARRWLGHIHGEAQRLARIVADLLDLARIESGGALEMARDPVDLGATVGRNVDLFAAAHPRHRFVALGPGATPVVVRGDADAIDRVVKNLLSNAVKYSPAGGQVTVSVTAPATARSMAEIAVEDEGVGIPAAELPRIFERYVRVADPATSGARGLGLGLTLVRMLVEAHGGSISVASDPGRGSRFSVRLPA